MPNVSQEQAIDVMPLAATETTRFWRDGRFDGMECLSATFLTHEYSPHAHETFSIGAIESGLQISTIQGTTEQTGPGHLYLINPDDIHDGAPGGCGYRYRMIYPTIALLRNVIEDVTGRAFHGTPSFPRFLPYDPQMATAFQIAHHRMEMKVGALEADEGMYCVMAELFRRYGSSIILPLEKSEKTAVHTTRDYLNDNFDVDIGLEELAKTAGLSRAHLIRAFRKEFHITPHAYLTDVRIRKAKKFLRNGEPLADIAALCGFADQAHFNRHFKARMGITPGQFRAA
ncbi:AraC family transcriptional regulator [Rhizobium skierniewicense]|nr:AraC family transcriptional regulator [Rhizobium skierniewicense]